METKTLRPQTFVGTVVKTAMKDTATVKVDRYVKNAKYKKYFVRSKKYLAHDPGNSAMSSSCPSRLRRQERLLRRRTSSAPSSCGRSTPSPVRTVRISVSTRTR